MRKYGVCYKGSKNRIAEWVISSLPRAENFYDLFAGGCAVTHCAMANRRYQNYCANDILNIPRLFEDAIEGKYRNETRWISREDFFRLKDTDLYVQYYWSFGNNGHCYMYGELIEPYKKACHYAIVFDDWEDFEKLCPEVSGAAENALDGVKDTHGRRIRLGPAIVKELKRLDDWSIVEGNVLYKSCKLKGTKKLQCRSLQSLERLESLEKLSVSQGDYRDVKIKPDSVVYCDIPYRNTDGYKFKGGNKNPFDYDAFYDWCARQTELVVVSEYNMPENDFVCIGKKETITSLCNCGSKKTVEKLFVPEHQIEMYKEKMGMLI